MEKYKLVKYKKGKIVLKYAQNAEDYFYIISSGKVIAYNDFYEKTYMYKRGDIIGLISSVSKEPYYSTIETIEDTELWKIKTKYITKINNVHLINRISHYLSFIFEIWLSKYYTEIVKNKMDLYNKEDILTIANIYKNNGFKDASYKICSDYIKLFNSDYNVDKVKNFIKSIDKVKEPQHINNNSYKIYKGYCLYSELGSNNNIYYIRSGRVGIYNIIDSDYSTRIIYPKEYIIDSSRPKLEYTPLSATAIVLEDSIIDIMSRDELIKQICYDKEIRLKIVRMISMKVVSTILKIKAIKKSNFKDTLIVFIYSLLKVETLFYNKEYIKLYYKMEDIKNMLHKDIDIDEIKNTLKTINHVEFDSFNNIIITNIKKYFDEYKIETE
ncbi:cyclic nucleotide-binding domain-containing protein [Brachyspira sp.]|uniref:cyclic nucleotide-binding domain-containing protein n=1 Tax=Brachyspira sp. TaxID=1977261 RepID=UPI0026380BB2|nr:cyclic nucleotide-binding domain-containing protein [Brachyspira sp.]